MKPRGDRLEHRAVVDERGHQGALLHRTFRPTEVRRFREGHSGRMPVVDGQVNWKSHEALFRVCILCHSRRIVTGLRGIAWCSTSRKAETMLGRSFSGRTARGPRRRGAGGKGRRSTCPRFLVPFKSSQVTLFIFDPRVCPRCPNGA